MDRERYGRVSLTDDLPRIPRWTYGRGAPFNHIGNDVESNTLSRRPSALARSRYIEDAYAVQRNELQYVGGGLGNGYECHVQRTKGFPLSEAMIPGAFRSAESSTENKINIPPLS